MRQEAPPGGEGGLAGKGPRCHGEMQRPPGFRSLVPDQSAPAAPKPEDAPAGLPSSLALVDVLPAVVPSEAGVTSLSAGTAAFVGSVPGWSCWPPFLFICNLGEEDEFFIPFHRRTSLSASGSTLRKRLFWVSRRPESQEPGGRPQISR